MKTVLTKPQEITTLISGDPNRMCTDRDAVFAIPQDPNKAIKFVTSLVEVCGVNFTIVEQEMVDLLGIDVADMERSVSSSLCL